MKADAYSDIYDYCRWNKAKNISDILNSNIDIDLLYKEGIYFKFAFKHNNNGILDTLLSYYYDRYKLNESLQDYNLDQKVAKQRLLQVLEECVEAYDLSENMTEVFKKYSVDLGNDDSDIDELERSFENDIIISEQKHNSLSTTHDTPEHYSPEENEYSKILYDIINPPAIKINDAEVRFMGQDSSDYNKPDVSIFENQEL